MNRFVTLWSIALLATAVLVLGCYVYIDVPLARWAHQHQLRQYGIFHGLQALSDIFLWLSPALLLVVGWRRYHHRARQWDQMALEAVLSILLVSVLKYPLKFTFGRYWPATFYENNPSLLHDNAYGFNFFHAGVAYSAFPSGHAAVAAAVATVLWCYYPRYRAWACLLWLLVALGLLGAYYHFVGDIVSGTLLGAFVASLVMRLNPVALARPSDHRV